ncbi:hypothetical protein ACQP1O_22725 [Nocardia sp. CA-151230]|uniref:hypothetical protein n=1 Tax=Nocardia sp. CA-151230 TaxID=3239982 RepID=UPI003D8F5CAF
MLLRKCHHVNAAHTTLTAAATPAWPTRSATGSSLLAKGPTSAPRAKSLHPQHRAAGASSSDATSTTGSHTLTATQDLISKSITVQVDPASSFGSFGCGLNGLLPSLSG